MRKLYIFALLSIISFVSNAQVGHLLISQVYGAGGNTNATFKNDFVEIFNPTTTVVDLSTYTIQYATARSNNTDFNIIANLSGTLQPGQFYLIQLGSGGSVGNALPTPVNSIGTQDISAAAGKIILVNSTTPIGIDASGCPTTAPSDFIGYGTPIATTGANCAETSAKTATGNNTASLIRTNVCADANNNSTDFTNSTTITPRNTSTTVVNCPNAIPLPVKFTNLKASKKAAAIELSFSNATEKDVVNYDIERSTDGIQFTSIATLKTMHNDGSQGDYIFTDERPLNGVNFYRIKATETSGKVAYSLIVKINAAAMQSGLTISPNPVKNGVLNFQVSNLNPGAYDLLIRNTAGQIVHKQRLRNVGNEFSQTLLLNNLKAGMYYLEISGASKISKQFIVQ